MAILATLKSAILFINKRLASSATVYFKIRKSKMKILSLMATPECIAKSSVGDKTKDIYLFSKLKGIDNEYFTQYLCGHMFFPPMLRVSGVSLAIC